MNLNWLDFLIIAIMVLSVVEGITKGFTRVGIGLAATLIGLVLGIWFYGVAGYYLLPYVKSESIADFVGFWIVFGVCVIAGAILGAILAKVMEAIHLRWLDCGLGIVAGGLRGVIAAIALVFVLIAFSPNPPPRSVVRSHYAPYVIGAANVAAEFAPRELRDAFFESYEKVKDFWNQHVPKKKLRLPETEI